MNVLHEDALVIECNPDAGIHTPPKFPDNFVLLVSTYFVAKLEPRKAMALHGSDS
jgi:hypothetical protein